MRQAADDPLGRASRRSVLMAAAGLAAASAVQVGFTESAAANAAPFSKQPKDSAMGTLTMKDGTSIYYKDWGSGPPVVFSHGWPLSSDAFEDQMFFLASRGYRVIAADRRGHGRSGQSWAGNDIDTYAEDLAHLVDELDLYDTVQIGHSTGGGVVTRYVANASPGRVSKAVLISAIPPFMLKTPTNPVGQPIETFDKVREAVQLDRAQFWNDLSDPFFGYNRPGAKVSKGVREQFVMQCMMAGFPASYLGIKAWSETDLTDDLKKVLVPTLIVHGDDDQIVPIKSSALLSAEIVRSAQLKVYEGAPHGLPTTHKARLNEDLLSFIKRTS